MECNHHSCLHIVPLFQHLNSEQMHAITLISKEKHYTHSQIIYSAGDESGPLIVVNTGKIKIYRLDSDGSEQVMRILLPGDFTNELSLFSTEAVQDFAVSIEHSSVCMIDGKMMNSLMEEYPSIALKITQELTRRLIDRDTTLHSVAKGSVNQRIANYFVELMRQQLTNEVQLPVSKGTIASLLAMSQETFSRKIKLFQEMGIITVEKNRKITILDREALLEEATM